jgi:hypothetical protein
VPNELPTTGGRIGVVGLAPGVMGPGGLNAPGGIGLAEGLTFPEEMGCIAQR